MNFLYLLFTSVMFSFVDPSDVPFGSFERAFSAGNAAEITAMGKDRIMLNVIGKEAVYSQNQAMMVLKDFFLKKPVLSFKLVFKSKETNDGSFAVGNYEAKGETFRVTVQFKKLGAEYKIESLSIEK